MPMLLLGLGSWFAVAAIGAVAEPDVPSRRRLTAAQVAADLRLAEEAYIRIHPGYDRYTDRAELDKAWRRLADEAEEAGGLELGAFYMGVQSVLARIKCDHTKAELGRAQVAWRKENPVLLPFRWEVRRERAVVTKSKAPGIGAGDEILAVDGVTIPALVRRTLPFVPADGDTLHAREAELGHSLEFRGGAIEHLSIEMGGVPRRASLEIRHRNGVVETVEVPRVSLDVWRELTVDSASDFATSVRLASLSPDVAYLAVDSFVNYRNPVRPDSIYDAIFKRIARKGQSTLILDLRKNGGGSQDALARLYAHLIREPDRLLSDVRASTLNLDGLREHLSSWDKRILNPRPWWFRKNEDGTYSLRRFLNPGVRRIRPDRRAFRGRLIVLSSRANSSAISTLLANLSDTGRVTIVGEPTGGSSQGVTANVLLFLRLPHSDFLLRIPGQRIYNDVRTYRPRLGVAPHVLVETTVDDVVAGRDPPLAAARALAGLDAPLVAGAG